MIQDEKKYEKFLPIGSIVKLKDAEKLLMVVGYGFTGKVNNENKFFDYCSCLYPEGILDPKKSILFDHDNIDKVEWLGFEDEGSFIWRNFLIDNYDDIKKKAESGQKNLSESEIVTQYNNINN